MKRNIVWPFFHNLITLFALNIDSNNHDSLKSNWKGNEKSLETIMVRLLLNDFKRYKGQPFKFQGSFTYY